MGAAGMYMEYSAKVPVLYMPTIISLGTLDGVQPTEWALLGTPLHTLTGTRSRYTIVGEGCAGCLLGLLGPVNLVSHLAHPAPLDPQSILSLLIAPRPPTHTPASLLVFP
jgi:hypothetical protein